VRDNNCEKLFAEKEKKRGLFEIETNCFSTLGKFEDYKTVVKNVLQIFHLLGLLTLKLFSFNHKSIKKNVFSIFPNEFQTLFLFFSAKEKKCFRRNFITKKKC
jgi:hypothetical protein